jgi:hypothetical protein
MVNNSSFSPVNDVFKNNEGLAGKRELTDWEYHTIGNKK